MKKRSTRKPTADVATENSIPPLSEVGDKAFALERAIVVTPYAGATIREDSPAIPPCPPGTPDAGDKTPEVILWWFKYHPEEAAAKYNHRTWDRSILENL